MIKKLNLDQLTIVFKVVTENMLSKPFKLENCGIFHKFTAVCILIY